MAKVPVALAILTVAGVGVVAGHVASANQVAAPQPPAPPLGATPAPLPPKLVRCEGRAAPQVAGEKFRHKRSRVVAKGTPAHFFDDVVQVPGAFDVRIKLAYGRFSKDLEDERVRLFVDDCTGWRELGTAIVDGDGRARVTAPAMPAGIYELLAVVPGDGSQARARAWLLPRATRLVVFDVDGTLTTDDGELLEHIVASAVGTSAPPAAYPGGAALTRAHADDGDVVVYLSGRPAWLRPHTAAWLAAGGYAPGPILLAPSLREAAPTTSGVGRFKTAALKRLTETGFAIPTVYGNASTDVFAYGAAGIPRGATYIIGKHGGSGGTVAVSSSTGWTARASDVLAAPRLPQPFSW